MPAEQHPAYQEEQVRLGYTLAYVAENMENTLRKKNDLDEEIRRLDRAATDENSQAFIDLIVKSNIQSGLALRLRNLHNAKSRPYFARVDFSEDGAPEAEKLYIGKMSLMREDDQKLVIVDWRASVANLYYEGRLGRTSYACLDGEIGGEMTLKRQFSIAEGSLREIADIDITTTDEFLGVVLGANAENRLKEIVSTIQEEQNRIIRSDMETPLVVQGAAGSGKTTIALHRIAYLIYNYGESFEPEDFMIIAPNKLFLNYISEVLPELGVERVRQTTFEDLAAEVIGGKFAVRDANEKLILLMEDHAHGGRSNRLLREAAVFKSSMAYKDMLERYIGRIERTLLPDEDLRLDARVFFTGREVHDLFFHEFGAWPVFKRVELIKKRLARRARERKENFIHELQEKCNADVRQIKAAMEESEARRLFIVQIIERKDELARRLEERASAGVREYFRKLPRRDVLNYYREFLEDPAYFANFAEDAIGGNLCRQVREGTLAGLKAGTVEIEDIAPLLYLKYRLFGLDEKIRLRHLVIDEAQDFSVFQLYALRKLVGECSFTILGDLAQGIHSYRGARDWNEIRREVFDDRARLLTLEQSYRTTVEIMSAANTVLAHLDDPNLVKARPVLRHGEAVQFIKTDGPAGTAREIAAGVREALSRGLKTAAVIGKIMEECGMWRERLRAEGLDLQVITGREAEYRGGLVIVPAYLAKGLEFDAVMIADAGADMFGQNELDIKLLYVAMTRALHRLAVYYQGTPSPLLGIKA